jgi:hypothetical protein
MLRNEARAGEPDHVLVLLKRLALSTGPLLGEREDDGDRVVREEYPDLLVGPLMPPDKSPSNLDPG